MENIEKLTMLEAAVDKLLAVVVETRKQKQQLKDKLASLDQDVVTLKEQVQVLQSERSQIGQRVNTILSSIDKWEQLNKPVVDVEKTDSAVKEKTLF